MAAALRGPSMSWIIENIAEEIAGLAKAQRNGVGSQSPRLATYLPKGTDSARAQGAGWQISISSARDEILEEIEDFPVLAFASRKPRVYPLAVCETGSQKGSLRAALGPR